jgi:uncharacterized damage-inducible protein DinB
MRGMLDMLDMLRDLIAHKWYADAAVLTAVRGNDAAAADPEIRELLLHVLVANRFWLANTREIPFDLEAETRAPESLDALIQRYRETQAEEAAWLATAAAPDLARPITSRFFPGETFSVLQGLTQVCMHSHGHRAQCAKMFRRHGGVPPMIDYILWLVKRPPAVWPAELAAKPDAAAKT